MRRCLRKIESRIGRFFMAWFLALIFGPALAQDFPSGEYETDTIILRPGDRPWQALLVYHNHENRRSGQVSGLNMMEITLPEGVHLRVDARVITNPNSGDHDERELLIVYPPAGFQAIPDRALVMDGETFEVLILPYLN